MYSMGYSNISISFSQSETKGMYIEDTWHFWEHIKVILGSLNQCTFSKLGSNFGTFLQIPDFMSK